MLDYDETPKSSCSDGIATFGDISRTYQRKKTVGLASNGMRSGISENLMDERSFEDICTNSISPKVKASNSSSTNTPVCNPCVCLLF